MSDVQVDETLDCKGMLCPLPIVKLSKTFKALDSGKVVLLLATDPGSEPDIAAWEKRTKNQVLQKDKEGDVFKFWIKKTA